MDACPGDGSPRTLEAPYWLVHYKGDVEFCSGTIAFIIPRIPLAPMVERSFITRASSVATVPDTDIERAGSVVSPSDVHVVDMDGPLPLHQQETTDGSGSGSGPRTVTLEDFMTLAADPRNQLTAEEEAQLAGTGLAKLFKQRSLSRSRSGPRTPSPGLHPLMEVEMGTGGHGSDGGRTTPGSHPEKSSLEMLFAPDWEKGEGKAGLSEEDDRLAGSAPR
jgi:hypothetical protein